ncbi:MAG: hypothetical protein SVM86_07700 [Candidatus Cloacimonadota bacterium]|nr:hypothetical protein [Candidatus Cloacimonadota bacterium]
MKLISHSNSFASNYALFDIFKNQEKNIILLTHNIEDYPFLKKVNSHILKKVMELDLQNVLIQDLAKTLREFFVELNWQLYSIYRKADTQDFGISLILAIIVRDEIYLVRFGRLLAAKLHKKDIEYIGEKWDNFKVKSRKDLFLLGSRDEDIPVKIHRVKLQENEYFFCLDSITAEKMQEIGFNHLSLKENLTEHYKKEPFPYFIIEAENSSNEKKRKIWHDKRLRILTIFIALAIIISALYVNFGKNYLAVQQNILKYKISENQKSLLEFAADISLYPHQSITLKKDWEKLFPKGIHYAPLCDMKNIYISSQNELMVYRKISDELRWSKKFQHKIVGIELLDANRILVITDSNDLVCLNRDLGSIVWENKIKHKISEQITNRSFFQISFKDFRQLTGSIFLVYSNNNLKIIDVITGQNITSYEFSEKIKYVSSFDLLEKCLYVVEGDKLSKLVLDVK